MFSVFNKMVFGIDLGTTNSLIGSGDKLFSNLVSSSVDVEAKCQVDRDTVGESIISSYKTDMSMGEDGQLAIQCSSVILKDLAKKAKRRCGQEVKDVVISVPAYFSTTQREAVYEAAKIAELNVKCLINEPTAAAIYLCRDVKDLIVVYDLGGGTFDVTIVDSRLGTYQVIATDGKILGGDDLDNALVEKVFIDCKIPIRYRTALNRNKLRSKMRLAKEEIQKTRNTVYVDLTDVGGKNDFELTEEIYKKVVYETFSETFEKTNYLIEKYIPESDVHKAVLVGGSSFCPYLREMIEENIPVEIIADDTPPDLIVAKGVSIYAKMVENGSAVTALEDVTKRLCIADYSGKTITVIESNTVIPCESKVIVQNNTPSSKLKLRLYQGDSIMAKKNDYIGMMVYDYGREVPADEGVVEVTVRVAHDGVVSLSACEVLYSDFVQEVKLIAR